MPDRTRSRASSPRHMPHKDPARYAFYTRLLGVCFIAALVIAMVFALCAPVLGRLGLTASAYYVLLLVLGLLAGGFLYGTLRLYGLSHRRQFGVALEVGGPVAILAMVVILGFVLPSPSPGFLVTVLVHGEAGPNDLVARGSGRVVLDLGGEHRREWIDRKGQAFFGHVPASFLGQEAGISLDSDVYEPADPGRRYRLDGKTIELVARRKPAPKPPTPGG
jgi:hypothetical protein